MLGCGLNYSLIINSLGEVWGSGKNDLGQLGQGDQERRKEFCQVKGLPPAVQLSVSEYGNHSAVLDYEGNVWTFGRNDSSQTGNTSLVVVATPFRVSNLPVVLMVACGYDYSVVLDNELCIWGTGNNKFGQLGCEEQLIKEFTRIVVPDDVGRISKVRCGLWHTIIQSEQGELWGAGHNRHGALGIGNCDDARRFQKIIFSHELGVKDFSCAMYFSLLLDDAGGVWATGFNDYGQAGFTEETHSFKQIIAPKIDFITCGAWSSMMIDVKGNLYTCGYNMHGQLGLGHRNFVHGFQKVMNVPKFTQGSISYHSMLEDEKGCLWVAGNNTQNELGVRNLVDSTNIFLKVEGIEINGMGNRFYRTKRAQ